MNDTTTRIAALQDAFGRLADFVKNNSHEFSLDFSDMIDELKDAVEEITENKAEKNLAHSQLLAAAKAVSQSAVLLSPREPGECFGVDRREMQMLRDAIQVN